MDAETSKGLRSVVCIKQVPKAQELQVDPVTKTLRRAGVPSEINPPDLNALETALQLKDNHGGEVVAVSMGPPVFIPSLEQAIGMGCDRAVLLTDRKLAASDTVPTALALSEAILKVGEYDLVFCGEETTDSSTGHVGPGIAGHLDIPQITYVSEVELVNGKVRGKRSVEDGFEVWECSMPALVTVNFGCNRPRLPTLTGKIRARRPGSIIQWSADDVGLKAEEIGLKGSPTIVAKVETVRLPDRQGKIFRGDVKEAVRQFLDCLAEDGLLGI
ncbi:MAG: electron transfer flavoprotein subunit beta/FixA family protein [Thermoplasmata archaeon]